MNGLFAGLDAAVGGYPLFTTLSTDFGFRDWFKSGLGMNNGVASCAALCVAIPAQAEVVRTQACFTDDDRKYGIPQWVAEESKGGFASLLVSTNCGDSSGNDVIRTQYWASVHPSGEMVSGEHKMVCSLVKSWSHNKWRNVTWRVSYQ